MTAQLPQTVYDVLAPTNEVLRSSHAILVFASQLLADLAHCCNISELPLCFSPGRFASPALRSKLVYLCIEMEAQLFLDISRDIGAKEAEIAPPQRSVWHYELSCARSWVARSTLATASAYASQILISDRR